MKIAVLVSGGVDSSVALHLLKAQQHDLTAFYLKIWLEDELSFLGECPWEDDLKYVKAVCAQLNVPLQVISLQKEYHDEVVSYTINEVKQGRTPNPDILCNKRIKFGMFWDTWGQAFDKVATGHYAQVKEDNGLFSLWCAPDTIKDQTYFLSHLSQAQLSKALFPVGHLTKQEVRACAQTYDLLNKNRKDSQGICFLGKLKFRDFLAHYLKTQRGDLIEYETGIKYGEHDGFWFYTIGQRQGIRLAGGPWYVVAKSATQNIVYISREYYAMEKNRDTFIVHNCNWITTPPDTFTNVKVKIRHGAHLYDCHIERMHDNHLIIRLHERDQGIAPGQFAVLYKDAQCLGGGIIAEIDKDSVLHEV